MMELLIELFKNKIFLSVLFTGVIAQLIKWMIHPRDNRSLFSFLTASGGMPSAHAAAVSALVTAVYWTEGVSTLLVLAIVLAVIVIIDALGVRYATGENTMKINRLITILHQQFNVQLQHAKVLFGHTVSQVIVGILLGFFITLWVFSL